MERRLSIVAPVFLLSSPAQGAVAQSPFSATLANMPQNPTCRTRTPRARTQSAIPITSRFLFVDVAAQRAKAAQAGALPRIDRHAAGHTPHKLRRVAMERSGPA